MPAFLKGRVTVAFAGALKTVQGHPLASWSWRGCVLQGGALKLQPVSDSSLPVSLLKQDRGGSMVC